MYRILIMEIQIGPRRIDVDMTMAHHGDDQQSVFEAATFAL